MSLSQLIASAACATLSLVVAGCAGPSLRPAAGAQATAQRSVAATDRKPNPSAGRSADVAAMGDTGSAAMPQPAQPVEPEVLALGDLPVVKWPKPPVASEVAENGPLQPAPETVIDTMGRDLKPDDSTLVRVSLQNEKLAWIRIGRSEGAVTSGGQGGVTVVCGANRSGRYWPNEALVPVRWETLAAAPGGRLVYTVVEGWFNVASCTLGATTRTSVAARAILGGMLFAFREACTDCAHQESVTFLGPHLERVAASGMGGEATISQGAWSRITLPLRRGGAGSLLARLGSFDLQSWASACGVPVLSGRPAAELLVGVEISQAVSDSQPTAIAFLSRRAFTSLF